MGNRYKDQVVVITGGGRGIGRAIALEFAEEGANCVLAGRNMTALRVAASEVNESGGRGDVIRCDVAIEDDLKSLVEQTMRTYERIDVLVNNAGVVSGGRLDEIAEDDVRRMSDVNVWAPIRLTQLVLPHMRAAKSGTIVNISSVAGRVGMPFYATYCASKYAIRGFSEALRRELRPDGIHVVAVFPGPTATDLIESVDFGGTGMSVATAEQVAQAVLRGVRWRQPEVFIGLGETLMSRWNDILPWTVDLGVDVMRERMASAVANQRTT